MVNLLPHPFLKWAGGKTQLVGELKERKPPSFNAYHEPFVGSGALFFKLFRDRLIQRASISDLNSELIDAYIAVRDQVDSVIGLLSEYPHNEDFYYSLRAKNPQELDLPARAARMIYLNKTGYNGLYRVNSRGGFNVPFGRYKSPKYLDQDNLRVVSKALQEVEINCSSFETILARARSGDWVYFDPPYDPLSPTANFTSYHANGFSSEDQKRLRDVCIELSERNVYIMLSNSATETIRALYSAYPGFAASEVLANRAINSNSAKRGKITELIITNYAFEIDVQLKSVEKRIP